MQLVSEEDHAQLCARVQDNTLLQAINTFIKTQLTHSTAGPDLHKDRNLAAPPIASRTSNSLQSKTRTIGKFFSHLAHLVLV